MQLISLDSRGRLLLEYLLKTEEYIDGDDLAQALEVSRRSMQYDLVKVNNWLSNLNIPLIQMEKQNGILLSSEQRKRIKQFFHDQGNLMNYIFSQEERLAIIACELMMPDRPKTAEALAQIFGISRNTVLIDMKILKTMLLEYGLLLKYDQRMGYICNGEIIKKRAIFLYNLSIIFPLVRKKIIPNLESPIIEDCYQRLCQIEIDLNVEYVEGTLQQLAILVGFIIKNSERVQLLSNDLEDVLKHKEYSLVSKCFPELPEEERLYLSIHLLGARVLRIPGDKEKLNKLNLSELANKMVEEFENIACIEFDDRQQLISRLSGHLNNSFYRYKYGIIESNPLVKDVEKKYAKLFEITDKVAKNLYTLIHYPLNKSEIAYLTMYFGAYIRHNVEHHSGINVLVICPNGISTAQLLKREIEEMLPILEVQDIISLKELREYEQNYDLIISTVELDDQYPHITVNVILTPQDRQAILSYIMRVNWGNYSKLEMERIYNCVKKYVPKEQHEILAEDLEKHFGVKLLIARETAWDKNEPGLIQLLKPQHIQIVNSESDWRSAITQAALPLLENGSITKAYVDAAILCIELHGAYPFIFPQVILAHAKPENGVQQLSVALLGIREGVWFPGGKIAKMIIVLAPVDKKQHFLVLKDILQCFKIEENLNNLLAVEEQIAAYCLINNILQHTE